MAVKGTFGDISFVELLQLMHLSRKTGRIEVTIGQKWAMVIIREGVVWHVEPRGFGGLSPEEIIFEIIRTVEGGFTFQRLQVLPMLQRTVNLTTENLILEGTKRMDDDDALAHEMGDSKPMSHALKFRPGAEAKVRYVPQNVKKVVQAIDGQRNITDVIKHSQLDATQAAQIIKELIDQNVIETVEIKKEEEAPQPAST